MNKPATLLFLCAALLVPLTKSIGLTIDDWWRGATPITSELILLPGPMSISMNLGPVVYVREDAGVFNVPVVVRDWVPGDPTKFEIVTVDGTAKAGSDYVRPPRAQEFLVVTAPSNSMVLTQPVMPIITPPWIYTGPVTNSAALVSPGPVTLTPFPSIGQTFTINVPITILNPPNTAGETVEGFTVALRAPKGTNLNIGYSSTVTVRVLDSVDNKPPSAPTITQPALVLPKAQQPPDSLVVVSGLARDDKGVQAVEISINGSPYFPANLTSPGLPSTFYSVTIQPQDYVNELKVRTRDWNDQLSPAAMRTFRFRKESPLTVNVDASLATLTPAGFAGTTTREEGVTYKVSVAAKKGAPDDPVFERWIVDGAKLQDIGVTQAALLKPALSFTHTGGLKLTAHFAPNRFPKGAATYHAVLRSPAEKIDRTNETAGFITLNVLPTRAFTARLIYGGKVHRLSGSLSLLLLNTTKPNELGYGAEFLLDQYPDRALRLVLGLWQGATQPYIECSVHDDLVLRGDMVSIEHDNIWRDAIHGLPVPVSAAPLAMSSGVARVALYDGAKKTVPPAYLGAQDTPGYYTSTMYANNYPSPPQLRFEDFPQASGVASMSVAKNGLVTYFGRLPDDTPFTASTVIVEGMRCPFLVPLYGGKGFLTSEVELQAGGLGSDASGVESWWCRPAQDDALHYPQGWPKSLPMELLAAKYPHAAGRTLFYYNNGSPGPVMAPVHPTGNVVLSVGEYSTGPPEWPFPKRDDVLFTFLNVADNGTVTKIPNSPPGWPNPTGWTLQVDAITGHCHGTFEHPDGTRPSFRGVIYQEGRFSSVHGYYTSPLPKSSGGTGYIYISPVQYP